ncbi:hypothetical protein GPL21_07120 [Bradyrhizobium pachyrhizi]|uniref:Uncharacterized protein n=1 Tax=Bradyrhizobium pachyrhizi TaxID=280333 RepID=A0A844SH32_9BRAD|nr:DUF5996 family protein [Bradyrhizobium pachyrhizi]MVT64876.1 hypothetical protein [Bradyrhizobium pachyrhizi]
MSVTSNIVGDPWPYLSYEDFAATQHLLHMSLQAVGKLKLKEPFQPQWAEVPLWLTCRGLTTGPIPYAGGAYEITTDFISHEVGCATSWGFSGHFELKPMSVAELVDHLFGVLRDAGVNAAINLMPQEVSHPIPFDEDKQQRPYESALVNNWWQILLSTQRVMQVFHGRFRGKTQPIGLMWGTLDIRDVRYNGRPASPGTGADYIRRNAMNEEQVEVGWWSGSSTYPKPAFYSFTYPQPEGIESGRVSPPRSRWDPSMGEFLLDYDDLRNSKNPDADLLSFFESSYEAGAERAGWDSSLVGSGKPA